MTLTAIVLDDPSLARALRRLSGEWTAQTGIRIEIGNDEPPVDGPLPGHADVWIYPPETMGQWIEREAIIALRPGILERQGYDAADVLAVPAHPLTVWGEQAMAITLGCPVPVLYYRQDALAAIDAEPPGTWLDFARVADRLRERAEKDRPSGANRTGWRAALEPLSGSWAAKMLMVRAASAVIDASQKTALFEMESMAARIAEPPFVRALEQMRQSVGEEPPLLCDPAEARRSVLGGEAAMAISWPTATANAAGGTAGAVGIVPVPVSGQVYRFSTRQWRPRRLDQRPSVPVLGLEGRLASVTSASRNAPAAFRWLAWVGGPELGDEVATQSSATTLYRRSHLSNPARWMEASLPPAAVASYARIIRDVAGGAQWMMGLRLPGRERYLSELAAAVRRTLNEGTDAEASLTEAARQWEAITDAVGRDAQRDAYRSSLGL